MVNLLPFYHIKFEWVGVVIYSFYHIKFEWVGVVIYYLMHDATLLVSWNLDSNMCGALDTSICSFLERLIVQTYIDTFVYF